jgi:hypothetical protein
MIPPLDFGHLCDAVSEGGGGGNGEEILCAKEELKELLLGSPISLLGILTTYSYTWR